MSTPTARDAPDAPGDALDTLVLRLNRALLGLGPDQRLQPLGSGKGTTISDLFCRRGERVLFSSIDPRDGRSSLHLSEEGAVRRLHEDVVTADLTSDGDVVLVDGTRTLLVLDPDSGETRTLAREVRAFSVAPDGRRLALWVRRPAGTYQLAVYDTADLDREELLPFFRRRPPTSARGPSWSPAGRRLLAIGSPVGGPEEPWIISAGDVESAPRRVAAPGLDQALHAPRWLPGDLLVHESIHPDRDARIDLVQLDGEMEPRVVKGGLVAVDQRTGRLVVKEPDTLALRLIQIDPDRFSLTWSAPLELPGGEETWSVSYSTRYRRPLKAGTLTSWYSHTSSGGAGGPYKYTCACNGASCRSGHRGTDIAASLGTPIYAAAAGKVASRVTGCGSTSSCSTSSTSCGGGFGNHVRIQHSSGMSTVYAHMSAVKAQVGQSVSCGTVIGYVGSTGHSYGCHVHFEVWGTAGSGERLDPFAGSCNKAIKSTLWTSQSGGQPSATCYNPTPTFPRLTIKVSLKTINGQDRDFCKRDKSKEIFDWWAGQGTTAHVDVKNTGTEVAKNVEVGLWAEEPYVEVSSWSIYSNWKTDGSFKLNDTDSMQKIAHTSPGKSFKLWLASISPGETKRIKLEVKALKFSVGEVDHPDVRAWVAQIEGYYAKTSFSSQPSKNTKNYQTQNSGDLRAYSQTDVLAKESCDGVDNDCDGVVDNGCEQDSGGPVAADGGLADQTGIVIVPEPRSAEPGGTPLVGGCAYAHTVVVVAPAWPVGMVLIWVIVALWCRPRPRRRTGHLGGRSAGRFKQH